MQNSKDYKSAGMRAQSSYRKCYKLDTIVARKMCIQLSKIVDLNTSTIKQQQEDFIFIYFLISFR